MIKSELNIMPVSGLADTNPARVLRKTGIILTNNRLFPKLSEPAKDFVIKHEEGHFFLKTDDEFKADAYAFKEIMKIKGYQAAAKSVEEFSKILNPELKFHQQRIEKVFNLLTAQNPEKDEDMNNSTLFRSLPPDEAPGSFMPKYEHYNDVVGLATIGTAMGIVGTIGSLLQGSPKFYDYPPDTQNEAIKTAIYDIMLSSGQAKRAANSEGIIDATALKKSMMDYYNKTGWNLIDQVNHEIKNATNLDPIKEAGPNYFAKNKGARLNIGQTVLASKILPVLNKIFADLTTQEKTYKSNKDDEDRKKKEEAEAQAALLKKVAIFGGLGFILFLALIFTIAK